MSTSTPGHSRARRRRTSCCRRQFLKRALALSSAFPLFTAAGTKASGKVLGANEAVRIGIAGLQGDGASSLDGEDNLESLLAVKGARLACLIDPDKSLLALYRQKIEARGGDDDVRCFQDIRRALDDQDLDALIVATPNHWRALITIWACQAGKDVYVECPLSHGVFEGSRCVAAAQKYGRIVQHGTHWRSNETIAAQINAIRSGAYGRLLVAKARCCIGRSDIGFEPGEPPPGNLDYDLWLGPAETGLVPSKRFHRNLLHDKWNWFWDFGDGEIGYRGMHQLDLARWAIAEGTWPRRAWALGGRFFPDGPDQGQTPNMLLAVYDFGQTLLIFESRGLVAGERWKGYPAAPPATEGCELHTTDGVLRFDGGNVQQQARGTKAARPVAPGWTFYPRNGNAPEPVVGREVHVTPGGPLGSFIAAIRSRKPEDINANVQEGFYSSLLCHLASASYRSGHCVSFDEAPEVLGGQQQVVESFQAIKDNLRLFDFPLESLSYQLGSVLNLTEAGKIVCSEEAQRCLGPSYRAPFWVPRDV